MFGLWIYLMTDCILFGTLFATYLVLQNGTYGGVTSKELFDLPFVLLETLLLLISSFTCSFVVGAEPKKIYMGLLLTLALGGSFLALELSEFSYLVANGHSWAKSGFLSAYFTLVGTHGLHIFIGLLWIGLLLFQLRFYGPNVHLQRRLRCFGLFWHFLDIVWIFIFTIVYLMGVL